MVIKVSGSAYEFLLEKSKNLNTSVEKVLDKIIQKEKQKLRGIIKIKIDENNEEWKDINIENFPKYYQVSSYGRIRNTKKFKIRSFSNSGYQAFSFSIKGKHYRYLVHRIVATLFIPNPDNKPFVNHINGITYDNRVENLEWCTRSENVLHRFHTTTLGFDAIDFSSKKKKKIRVYEVNNQSNYKDFDSCIDAALFYKISKGNLSRICNNQGVKTFLEGKYSAKYI